MRAGITAPARSTCAMIQPPKMSPLPFASAGIGLTRITSCRSFGNWSGARESRLALEIWGILLQVVETAVRFFHLFTVVQFSSMRRETLSAPLPAGTARKERGGSDFATLKKLVPYVWEWRWRVMVALAFLVAAKLANIGVPLVLKNLVD